MSATASMRGVPATVTDGMDAPAVSRRVRILAAAAFVVVTGLLPEVKGGISPIHLLFMAVLPALLVYAARRPALIALWVASLVWVGGQVWVNHSHGLSVIASAAIAGVLMALFTTGVMWMRDQLGLNDWQTVLCCVIAWFLMSVLDPSALHSGDPWKFGIGETTTPLVLMLVGGRRSWWRNLLAVAVVGVLCFVNDSRSLLGFAALAFVWAWMRSRIRVRHQWLVGLLAVAVLVAGYFSYPLVARAGLFGARAQHQQAVFDQTHANWLMANRKEAPQLLEITREHWPFGIGTYGPVTENDAVQAIGTVHHAAGPLTPEEISYLMHDGTTIGYHAHSQLLATTVYGGVFPIAFWLITYILLLIGLGGRTDRRFGAQQVAYNFLLLNVLWNSVFSPIAKSTIVSIPIALLIVLMTIHPARNPGPTPN